MYSPSASPLSQPPLVELLFVDRDEFTSQFVVSLREKFRVSRANAISTAVQYVARTPTPPSLIVTELVLPDGYGTDVCRAAKALNVPATVLVTTSDVQQVPDAIDAGCDAVLLKPFAPNLLFARLGRLIRARSMELQYQSFRQRSRTRQLRAKAQHLQVRVDRWLSGTNQHWPHTHCPHCGHEGVTSFEYTSYRRAWYACMECRKVWLAKRPE